MLINFPGFLLQVTYFITEQKMPKYRTKNTPYLDTFMQCIKLLRPNVSQDHDIKSIPHIHQL